MHDMDEWAKAADPHFKYESHTALLKQNKNRKIVIFSSFADTTEWVATQSKQHRFTRTLLYTGSSKSGGRTIITQNFDATLRSAEQKNDYGIIVATGALSEGFNLHGDSRKAGCFERRGGNLPPVAMCLIRHGQPCFRLPPFA